MKIARELLPGDSQLRRPAVDGRVRAAPADGAAARRGRGRAPRDPQGGGAHRAPGLGGGRRGRHGEPATRGWRSSSPTWSASPTGRWRPATTSRSSCCATVAEAIEPPVVAHRRRGRQAARRRDDGGLPRPRRRGRGGPRGAAIGWKPSRSPGTVRGCAPGCTSGRPRGSATTTSASTSTSPRGSPTVPRAASSSSPATRSRRSTAIGLDPAQASLPGQGRAQRRHRLLGAGDEPMATRSPRSSTRRRSPTTRSARSAPAAGRRDAGPAAARRDARRHPHDRRGNGGAAEAADRPSAGSRSGSTRSTTR